MNCAYTTMQLLQRTHPSSIARRRSFSWCLSGKAGGNLWSTMAGPCKGAGISRWGALPSLTHECLNQAALACHGMPGARVVRQAG